MRRLLALGLVTLACGGAEETTGSLPSAGGSASGGSGGSGGAPVDLPNPLGRYRCKAPVGANGSPQTIEEAVLLLNALPKPTNVACFVESLSRPLTIFATNSPFSAQPAFSNKSPRVFIKTGQLWSSIVIAGDASELIEFGYIIPNTVRSIKAELHLPIQTAVPPNAPYNRVLFGESGTACGLCHGDEQLEKVGDLTNVFSSIAFKPRADSHVSLDSLRLEAETCSWQAEPARCEMLAALFGGGPVVEEAFPESMVTFF